MMPMPPYLVFKQLRSPTEAPVRRAALKMLGYVLALNRSSYSDLFLAIYFL
jgi:hypothetical protein